MVGRPRRFLLLCQENHLKAEANPATDFTVKVDVGNLEPGTIYFYQFEIQRKDDLVLFSDFLGIKPCEPVSSLYTLIIHELIFIEISRCNDRKTNQYFTNNSSECFDRIVFVITH